MLLMIRLGFIPLWITLRRSLRSRLCVLGSRIRNVCFIISLFTDLDAQEFYDAIEDAKTTMREILAQENDDGNQDGEEEKDE